MGSHMHRGDWREGVLESTSKCSSMDSIGYSLELGRRDNTSTMTGGIDLPIPIVVGIAIAGFAIVFCTLTAIACYCARSRHKHPQRGKGRTLELERGNSDAMMALRSNPPRAIALGRETPYPMFLSRPSSSSRVSMRHSIDSKEGCNTNSRPLSQLRLSGLRDSWPLGWSISSPQSKDQSLPTLFNARPTTPVYASGISPQVSDYASNPRIGISKYGEIVLDDIGPAIRSTHSAKGSITSLKRSSNQRRSVSDDHLTSILRSTSQRLRDSQRSGRPRAASIMSYASGPPPDVRPPCLPTNNPTASSEGLIECEEELNCSESVKSSILSMYSRPSSPVKVMNIGPGAGKVGEPALSPVSSVSVVEGSDDDSICGEVSTEMVTPAGLTSPNKRRKSMRHKTEYSSAENSPTKGQLSRRSSLIAVGGINILSQKPIFPVNDASISGLSVTKTRLEGSETQSYRRATFGSDASIELFDVQAPLPLRIVPGHAKALIKETVLSTSTDANPFQWSPKITKTSIDPPKSTNTRAKGHKRSQTIRLSGLPRSGSNVSVVHEEPEMELSSPATPVVARGAPVLHISSPGSPSPFLEQDEITDTPSTSPFQSFLSIPSSNGGSIEESDRISQASYPLSVYDYYSNVDIFDPRFSSGPPKAAKKNRRHARNFSAAATSDLSAMQPFSRNSRSLSGVAIPRLPSPSQVYQLNTENLPPSPPSSPSPTRLSSSRLPRGPRSRPKSPPPSSLADSINLLRRMNSQLSNYTPVSAPLSAALTSGSLSPQILEHVDEFPLSPMPKTNPIGSPSPSHSPDSKFASPSTDQNSSRYSRGQSVRIASPVAEAFPSGTASASSLADWPLNVSESRHSLDKTPALSSCLKYQSSDIVASELRDGVGASHGLGSNMQVWADVINSRDSLDSLASSLNRNSLLNRGSGLGLRSIRDGSPVAPRKRKNSMWGAESVRGSRAVIPDVPVLPIEYANSMASALGAPKKVGGAGGMIVDGGMQRRARELDNPPNMSVGGSQLAPVWGEKWRQSLGLYDYDAGSSELYDGDGFLRSSPVTGLPIRDEVGR